MTGQKKIPNLIIDQSQNIVNKLIPIIVDTAVDAGIKNIGTPDVSLPDFCPSDNILPNLIDRRNQIVNELSSGAEIIKNLANITQILGVVVNVTDATLKTLNITKDTTTETLQVTPSPTTPPAVTASLTKLQKFINKLGPKLTTTKNILKTTNTALALAENIIFSILNILNSIDGYLKKCGASNFNPYSDYLNDINTRLTQQQNNPQPLTQEYQGFTLEIVEEPYTPTVTRRKAVAKNKSDIILLQTPLSFTTDSQILIEDLKLAIDRDNLKAD